MNQENNFNQNNFNSEGNNGMSNNQVEQNFVGNNKTNNIQNQPKGNKKLLLIVLVVIIMAVIAGFVLFSMGNKDNYGDIDNNLSSEDINISDEYVERKICSEISVKYKLHNPTSFWDSNDSFGTAEIDTILILSENGEPIENYYDNIEELSIIAFEVHDELLNSDDYIKNHYNRWFGISNLEVEKINDDVFEKHIKGEGSKFYVESYSFKHKSKFDSEHYCYYRIALEINKDNYSDKLIKKAIQEYHTIIDTFDFVK